MRFQSLQSLPNILTLNLRLNLLPAEPIGFAINPFLVNGGKRWIKNTS
jgi:hypothetical protein